MDPARFALAVPDDSDLLARLAAALAAQNAPPISIDRTPAERARSIDRPM